MSYFVVDVEADNTSPASGSMVCFGAVMVDDMDKTFYGETAPRADTFNPDALAVSGFSREQHEEFQHPIRTMKQFSDWLNETNKHGSPVFISDNLAFDWMWICYYFDLYNMKNPFGFSGRRIGDLYCGMLKKANKNHEWKRKYRKTKHTHNPVDDAKGNAEALIAFRDELGLNIKY